MEFVNEHLDDLDHYLSPRIPKRTDYYETTKVDVEASKRLFSELYPVDPSKRSG